MLREDRSKLDLGVKVVISVEVLSKLRAPLSFQLLRDCCHGDAVYLNIDFWNLLTCFKSPASNRGRTFDSTKGVACGDKAIYDRVKECTRVVGEGGLLR